MTNYEIKILNREASEPVEFTLRIISFGSSGNLVREDTLYGSVQTNSETVYLIEGTVTGEFQSYAFSIFVNKLFKPLEISKSRKGAVMSRTNITNTGELNITQLSFEDEILDGWTLKDFDKTISVTLFINGEKYKIPYKELTLVAIESSMYKVQIDFSLGIDLYQYNPELGQEVCVKTVYAFQPEWIIEIKYPMFPPQNLEKGEYTSNVSIKVAGLNEISIHAEDIARLVVIN